MVWILIVILLMVWLCWYCCSRMVWLSMMLVLCVLLNVVGCCCGCW